jgi:hypothetical protein
VFPENEFDEAGFDRDPQLYSARQRHDPRVTPVGTAGCNCGAGGLVAARELRTAPVRPPVVVDRAADHVYQPSSCGRWWVSAAEPVLPALARFNGERSSSATPRRSV